LPIGIRRGRNVYSLVGKRQFDNLGIVTDHLPVKALVLSPDCVFRINLISLAQPVLQTCGGRLKLRIVKMALVKTPTAPAEKLSDEAASSDLPS